MRNWLRIILRFLLYFIGTALACFTIALVAWLLWQWWLTEQARPTTQWQDTTIDQNLSPPTPGSGKSASQKVWIN